MIFATVSNLKYLSPCSETNIILCGIGLFLKPNMSSKGAMLLGYQTLVRLKTKYCLRGNLVLGGNTIICFLRGIASCYMLI